MDLAILGIALTVVGIFIGIGAYFVVNHKNVIKNNKVTGDMTIGNKINVKGDYINGDKTLINGNSTEIKK